jgi:hypothetical protein
MTLVGLAGLEPHQCRTFRLELVSVDSRTGLCQLGKFLPGNHLARSEAGAAFLAIPVDSGRQRPRYRASSAAKPRKANGVRHG